MRYLILMVGPPGSGKSTEAHRIVEDFKGHSTIVSADHFFMEGKNYNFQENKLSLAHFMCQFRAYTAMDQRIPLVIVDNCSMLELHRRVYAQMAAFRGYDAFFRLAAEPYTWNAAEYARRNVHGVTEDIIDAMIRKYQPVDEADFTIWDDAYLKQLQK